MVIYPNYQRSNATFENPQWAQNNTTEKQVSFSNETPMEYETSPMDTQTSSQELTQDALEHATETANVRFITDDGNMVFATRLQVNHQ